MGVSQKKNECPLSHCRYSHANDVKWPILVIRVVENPWKTWVRDLFHDQSRDGALCWLEQQLLTYAIVNAGRVDE